MRLALFFVVFLFMSSTFVFRYGLLGVLCQRFKAIFIITPLSFALTAGFRGFRVVCVCVCVCECECESESESECVCCVCVCVCVCECESESEYVCVCVCVCLCVCVYEESKWVSESVCECECVCVYDNTHIYILCYIIRLVQSIIEEVCCGNLGRWCLSSFLLRS